MSWRKFVIQRTFQAVITLFFISTALFIMFRLLPGDPTTTAISPALSGEAQQRVLEAYGLDEPLYIQYVLFIKNMVLLDWGVSFQTQAPVFEFLKPRIVNTIVIMVPIMFLSILTGIIVGTAAAWYRKSSFDNLITTLMFTARSVPIFFSGGLLLIIFSYKLQILPTGGMHSATWASSHGPDIGFLQQFLNYDFFIHALGPIIAGVFYYSAPPTLLMRSSMLENIGKPYLKVLESKGLSEKKIMFKHAARNSLLPVVTAASLMIGYAVGGQVLLETVFSWPGMGKAMVDSVRQNDYPVAQAAFVVMATTVVFLNLVADILYAYLDPRVSYDES
jgi:peptide/nickel transport system permease protein